MVDTIDKKKRSWVMSRVRSTNTKPEMRVRSALHRMGYRFRLHRKDLPGKPDVVLTKHRLAIFVHGCFWHRHSGCDKTRTPKTNVEFWEGKFKRNVERDRLNQVELRRMGWRVEVIWECEIKDEEGLRKRLAAIFAPKRDKRPDEGAQTLAIAAESRAPYGKRVRKRSKPRPKANP